MPASELDLGKTQCTGSFSSVTWTYHGLNGYTLVNVGDVFGRFYAHLVNVSQQSHLMDTWHAEHGTAVNVCSKEIGNLSASLWCVCARQQGKYYIMKWFNQSVQMWLGYFSTLLTQVTDVLPELLHGGAEAGGIRLDLYSAQNKYHTVDFVCQLGSFHKALCLRLHHRPVRTELQEKHRGRMVIQQKRPLVPPIGGGRVTHRVSWFIVTNAV